MEQHNIVLQNNTICYYVTYKRMKNIRMIVKKGCLYVSAPFYTKLSLIEDVIKQHQEKILKQLSQYQAQADYRDGGYVMIFDHCYRICLRDVNRMHCVCHDDILYIYHHDIEKCIHIYLKDLLQDYAKQKVKEYLLFFDLPEPVIIIKKYRAKWGCCFYQQQRIVLNLALIHLHQRLIDYVIMHELVHFLVPNHSQAFYHEIAMRMPDYRMRIQELKEKNI